MLMHGIVTGKKQHTYNIWKKLGYLPFGTYNERLMALLVRGTARTDFEGVMVL